MSEATLRTRGQKASRSGLSPGSQTDKVGDIHLQSPQAFTLKPAVQEPPVSKLHHWQQIPSWQRDNEYILTGYRLPSNSWRASLVSVFSLHNETVNIHTHLLGCLLFFALPIYTYRELYLQHPEAGLADIIVFAVFYYGVAVCFLFSSSFHVLSSHSPRVAALGNQLDYFGVILLMWGATIPTVYYGFHDDPTLQTLYFSVVSMLAILCSIATLATKFRTPAFRPYRAAMYASLGLSALVFVTHGVLLHGWDEQNRRMSLDWMLLMATLNLVGAVTYAVRIPERLFPETFDIVGSSHQILHVMVILAGLAHMMGLFRAFKNTHARTLPDVL